jgi:NADH:ubiquinone oxidoreductase subunit F (NADH-binding)
VTTADPRSPVEELLLRGRPLPAAAAHGARTYYSDHRAERGARHVRVCTGTGCFAATQGRQLAAVESALGVPVGKCAADGSTSLQAVHCLGYCYAGPAALDDDRPRVGPTLPEQLTGGAPAVDPPIPAMAVSRPVVLRGIVADEPAWQVWPALVTSPSGPTDVLREVGLAGLRGRGGAGFPAARKWAAVAASDDAGPRFVVGNGDEGDPGSFADRLLMESDPGRVLEGLALAGLACGATHGYVYVRSEYPRARAALEQAVVAARAAGHLGTDVHGSGVDFDVEVVSGHGSYVAGEETSLLRSMAGLRGTVRVRPPYPTRRGYLGRPTAVNNVETLAAVPAILADGGAAYARLGEGPETGTLLVCLTERFARPGAYEVELGTPLRAIVEDLGGGLADDAELRALQVGGPLGGFLAPADLDVPLLASSLAAKGASPGHGSLVAIDHRVSRAALLAHLWEFGVQESCGACTPCREGTRRGAADPTGISQHTALLDLMADGSLCAFGRRLPAAVRSILAVPPWT